MDSKKKIVVVGQISPPCHGSNIMTGIFLQALTESGYNYRHINKEFSLSSVEVGKFRLVKIHRIFKVIVSAIKIMVTYKPDILIYFISTKMMGLIPDLCILFIAKILGVHNVLYIHGVGHKKNYSNRLYKILYDITLSDRCSVIILSKMLRNDVNFITGKMHILPNCIIHSKNFQKNSSCSGEVKSANRFDILFLSNIRRAKGLLYLIQSLQEVIQGNPNVSLIVAGSFLEKDFENEVKCFIKKNNLNDYIQFVGPTFGEDKIRLLHAADLFVFPTYYEAFPLVVLEAMSFGLPVVSTNVGGIPDIIDDGVTGYVVPPKDSKPLADRIIFLMENESQRLKMGEKAKEKFINNYSFNAYKVQTNRIINEIK